LKQQKSQSSSIYPQSLTGEPTFRIHGLVGEKNKIKKVKVLS